MTRSNLRQPIEAVLDFGCDLIFARDVSGTTTHVLIGGQGYYLTVAGVRDQSGSNAADIEPIDTLMAPPWESWRDEMVEDGYWGRVATYQDGLVTEFIAARCLLIGDVPPNPDPLTALYAHGAGLQQTIEGWRSTFLDWIEIGLEVAVRESKPTTHQAGTGVIRAWGMGDDGVAYIGGGPVDVRIRWPRPISHNLWFRALAAASQDLTLPTEWGYIRDAQVAFETHDHRRAVLDAATAAEIAMTKLLDQRLATSSPEAATLVRDRYRQIGGLREALVRFGVELPDGIHQTKLAQPRNEAIHGGLVPSREVAHTAITVARDVADQASPRTMLF